jgi:Mn-dependent DtxR family transcriptional regulator
MLERLLNEIRSGGTLQPAALASRLNISVNLVEMMLEDLERRGLLAQINPSCETTCHGCSLADSCSPTSAQGRLWMWKPQKNNLSNAGD